ncbi:MAG: hypothetical protein HYV07_22555 [Deltaproteobacteria bacterium]|nr:hypothetical protein [Deltaproteobacteria bacterium]
MADTYIDYLETLGYGDFTAAQAASLLTGLDPAFDGAVQIHCERIKVRTNTMREMLEKAGALDRSTYASASTAPSDPVARARDLLRRATSYVESRPNGAEISAELRGGANLTTIMRRRPVKLAGALAVASEAISKHQASLAEHATWKQELDSALQALEELNTSVRASRSNRRSMTPEVTAARESWLVTYTAAKRFAESLLGPAKKLFLMSEIFDDLAETHKVAGVVDGGEPAPNPQPQPPS